MRRTGSSDDQLAGPGRELLAAAGETRPSGDHIERLVVLMMDMLRWARRVRWKRDLDDAEPVLGLFAGFEDAQQDRTGREHLSVAGTNDSNAHECLRSPE
jgi:hypothetical protein